MAEKIVKTDLNLIDSLVKVDGLVVPSIPLSTEDIDDIFDSLVLSPHINNQLNHLGIFVPTLNTVPDEDTISFNNGANNDIPFSPGNIARVRETISGNSYYRFFMLYDINSNNKATWMELNSYEKLTINLLSDQSTEDNNLIGATIEIYDNSVSGSPLYEYTWDGNPITCQIPVKEYRIVFGEVSGYVPPTSRFIKMTPGMNRSMEFTYKLGEASYITIDQNVYDPYSMISGDVNGSVIQWIRSNSHRYLGKYQSDGSMKICQLNDMNSNYYYDGTDADLTGVEGDVFMKLPEFYHHYEEILPDVIKIGFSRTKLGDDWIKWDGDHELLGAYESLTSSSKLYSRSGVTSTANLTQTNAKAFSRNRGTGYTAITWNWHCIMGVLYYAMYGNTNCQATIGAGTNTNNKITGLTNSYGMRDTVAMNSSSINFWGLENFWGNKWEWVDNVIVNKTSVDGIWHITELDGTERTVQGFIPTADTTIYSRKLIFGSNLDLMSKPDQSGGSDSTGYCDYQRYLNSTNRAVLRSSHNSSLCGGVASCLVHHDPSFSSADGCSRISFHGNVTIVESASEFKLLPVNN